MTIIFAVDFKVMDHKGYKHEKGLCYSNDSWELIKII